MEFAQPNNDPQKPDKADEKHHEMLSDPKLILEAAYFELLDTVFPHRHEVIQAANQSDRILKATLHESMRMADVSYLSVTDVKVYNCHMARTEPGDLKFCGLVDLSDPLERSWMFDGQLFYPRKNGPVLIGMIQDVNIDQEGHIKIKFFPFYSRAAFLEEAQDCDGLTENADDEDRRHICTHLWNRVRKEAQARLSLPLEPDEMSFQCQGLKDGLRMDFRVRNLTGRAFLGHNPHLATLVDQVSFDE